MPYDLPMMYLESATRTPMSENAPSPLVCVSCYNVLDGDDAKRMSKADFDDIYNCPCGEASDISELDVLTLPTSAHLLDKENAMNNIWFHTTTRENWEAKIKNPQDSKVPFVHAGTFEAAMERFEDQKNVYGWVYELRMAPDCELADDVYVDLDRWDYWADGIFEPEDREQEKPKHALRYVNRWEAAGSISLMLDPRKMEVVAVHPIGAHPPTKEESKALIKELYPAA